MFKMKVSKALVLVLIITLVLMVSACKDDLSSLVALTGVEDGQIYDSEVKPEIELLDDDISVEALLNGESFTLGTAITEPGSYQLLVKVTDSAGEELANVFNFDVMPQKDNLKLWLKADANLRRGSVSRWGDSSGNNNNAVQEDVQYQPTMNEDVINGKPVVTFDFFDSLTIPSLKGEMNSFSVIYLFRPHNTVSPQRFGAGGWSQFAWEAGTGGGALVGIDYDQSRITPEESGPGIFEANEWLALGFVFDNGEGRLYKEGELITSKDMIDPEPWTRFEIGSDGRNRIIGDLAELIIYDSALSDEELQGITSYFNNKYGL